MAKVIKLEEAEPVDLSGQPGVVGVTKRLLIGPGDGAPTFAVRLFSLSPGGHTPRHAHPFEHGVVVLSGRGEVLTQDGPRPLTPGTCVYIPPGEEHQFRNTGEEELSFLCVVPRHVEE